MSTSFYEPISWQIEWINLKPDATFILYRRVIVNINWFISHMWDIDLMDFSLRFPEKQLFHFNHHLFFCSFCLLAFCLGYTLFMALIDAGSDGKAVTWTQLLFGSLETAFMDMNNSESLDWQFKKIPNDWTETKKNSMRL